MPEVIEGEYVETPKATLVAHTGETSIVTRENLFALPPVTGTKTFKPIGHYHLVDTLANSLADRGILIEREQFALRHDNERLFATFDLNLNGLKGAGASLGLRTGNDKSMAIQIIAGMRIFVCDNLAFSGGTIILKRKHTSGLTLGPELTTAVDRYLEQYGKLKESVLKLEERELTDDQAKAIIYDLVLARRAMPVYLGENVGAEYFHPRHDEFKPRTAWSLHNAFTEVVKQVKGLPAQMSANQKIGRYFGLLGE